MDLIIAATILSVVVIVPTLTGMFLQGPGHLLRVIGGMMVLPLVWVWLLFGANFAFDVKIGSGDPWTPVVYFMQALAVGVVGAIIGGIGRAMARRQGS